MDHVIIRIIALFGSCCLGSYEIHSIRGIVLFFDRNRRDDGCFELKMGFGRVWLVRSSRWSVALDGMAG